MHTEQKLTENKEVVYFSYILKHYIKFKNQFLREINLELLFNEQHPYIDYIETKINFYRNSDVNKNDND